MGLDVVQQFNSLGDTSTDGSSGRHFFREEKFSSHSQKHQFKKIIIEVVSYLRMEFSGEKVDVISP